MSESISVPVAPDAVRVFRGFRLANISHEEFVARLGSVFIPSTVKIQTPLGLTAYMPSVMPEGHHPSAPDEIALVFYERADAYHAAKRTVGGRVYNDLHSLVFDMDRSLSGFPLKLAGGVEPTGRYHLFDESIDWQLGTVTAFVGVRASLSPGRFLDSISEWLREIQLAEGGPDGAIAALAEDHVVYWEHWPTDTAAEASRISGLASIADTVFHERIPPYRLDTNLWEPTEGPAVSGGESFNLQFRRRKKG